MPRLAEIANVDTGRKDLGRPMRLLAAFRGEIGGASRPRIIGQVAVAILLLASLCIGHPASSNKVHRVSPPQTTFPKIVALLQQKKYLAAKQQLSRLKLQYPHSARAFYLLGTAEYHLGELGEAESSFRRSLAINPNSPNTLYDLGILLLDLRRPATAIQYLEHSQKLMPPNRALSINLIRAYLDSGQESQARRIAESSEQKFHDSPAFFLALGNCFLHHGLAGQGRAALERANRLMPAQPEIVLPLAEACLQQRDIPCATRSLEAVRRQGQTIAQYHFLMAQKNFLAGQQSECLTEMQEALRLDPRNSGYLLALGRYEQKYGQQNQAIQVLKRAESLDPQQPEIPYSIAVSLAVENHFRRAAAYLDRALSLRPNYVRALFLEALSNLALANYAKTDRLLLRALRLNPQNPFCETFLAMSYLSEGKLSGAETQLRRAIALDPSYALPHYELGHVFLLQNNLVGERDEEEKAVTLDPHLYEAYYLLGGVFERLGEKQKAAKAFATFHKYVAVRNSQNQEMMRQIQRIVRQQH